MTHALSIREARKALKPAYHNKKAHVEQLNKLGILQAPGLFGRSRFEAPKGT